MKNLFKSFITMLIIGLFFISSVQSADFKTMKDWQGIDTHMYAGNDDKAEYFTNDIGRWYVGLGAGMELTNDAQVYNIFTGYKFNNILRAEIGYDAVNDLSYKYDTGILSVKVGNTIDDQMYVYSLIGCGLISARLGKTGIPGDDVRNITHSIVKVGIGVDYFLTNLISCGCIVSYMTDIGYNDIEYADITLNISYHFQGI